MNFVVFCFLKNCLKIKKKGLIDFFELKKIFMFYLENKVKKKYIIYSIICDSDFICDEIGIFSLYDLFYYI